MSTVPLQVGTAAVAVAIFIVLPFRSASRRIERAGWPVEPDVTFFGSATWKRTGGFPGVFRGAGVCLDFYPQGMVLRPRFSWLGWCVPRIELKWGDIEYVEQRWMGVRVVRLDKPGATFTLSGIGIAKRVMTTLRSYPVHLGGTR